MNDKLISRIVARISELDELIVSVEAGYSFTSDPKFLKQLLELNKNLLSVCMKGITPRFYKTAQHESNDPFFLTKNEVVAPFITVFN